MSESLKAARERVADKLGMSACEALVDDLRELQRQAMAEFMDWVVNHEGWRTLEDGNEPPIDALLDSEGA